jgi:predicted Rossmann-fold nucleotide-binding protein
MSKTIKVKSSENKKDWPIITVFSSVSPEAPKGFKDTCLKLGEEIAKRELKLSYSGSKDGCAKWMFDGTLKGKGSIKAVGYKDWGPPSEKRILNPPKDIDTGYILAEGDSLGQRIEFLKKNSIAIITLPGGPATMEELWNSVVGTPKPYKHDVPIIVYNIDNYFEGTKIQIQKMIDYFNWKEYEKFIYFADTFDDVLKWIDHAKYLYNLNKKNNKVNNLKPNKKKSASGRKKKMSKKKK